MAQPAESGITEKGDMAPLGSPEDLRIRALGMEEGRMSMGPSRGTGYTARLPCPAVQSASALFLHWQRERAGNEEAFP